jgi:hypothetical protein
LPRLEKVAFERRHTMFAETFSRCLLATKAIGALCRWFAEPLAIRVRPPLAHEKIK